MSRNYQYEVTIEDLDDAENDAIIDALVPEHFDGDAPEFWGGTLTFVGNVSLGVASTSLYAADLATIIAKAIDRKPPITINVTYLDRDPDEQYEFGVDEAVLADIEAAKIV